MEWYLEKLTPQEYELVKNYRIANQYRRYLIKKVAKTAAAKSQHEGESWE